MGTKTIIIIFLVVIGIGVLWKWFLNAQWLD